MTTNFCWVKFLIGFVISISVHNDEIKKEHLLAKITIHCYQLIQWSYTMEKVKSK